ncbi:MAG: DUF1080 domain-containing protein, partial [Planctomycetota bacterium]
MTTLLASLFSTAAAVAVPAGDPAGGGGVAAPAAAFHAIACVNDPLSHGTLGDGLLSLHEAILLHNGPLLPSQLSAAEAAQLSLIPGTGNTSDVTWIDIDAANTPLITIQQDLAPILDTPFGLLIKGFGDQVVFDFSGPGITHGLRVPSNSFSLQDIALVGGPYGLDVTQTDVTGQAGLSLQNVRFEGQATFGVNVTGAVQNAPGRAVLDRCRFVNVPLAFQTFEMAAGRSGIYELHDVEIAGATWGFWATLGAGGFSRFTFDRVDIDASTRGILITRLAVPSGRQVYVEGDHVRVRSADCAQIVGHPTGATWAILRGWDLRATGGGIALALGDPGHAVFGEVAELTAEGVVQLGCGAGPQPLALRNARCRNGPVTLATSATQALTVTESRFDGCAVSTLGGGPIAIAQSCFVGGSLQGNPRNEFLTTRRSFFNFRLKFEYKLVGTEGFVNGGVQFRSLRATNPPNEMIGYQADIGAGHTGSLYDESRRKRVLAKVGTGVGSQGVKSEGELKALEKLGGWNTYEVVAVGPRVMIYLNGRNTVDY